MTLPTIDPTRVNDAFRALLRGVHEISFAPVDFTFPASRKPEPEAEVEVYQHDFTAKIEAGVKLLDRKLGRDVWLPRVDVRTLALNDENLCVCAQATETPYFRGTGPLGNPDPNWNLDWGDEYGFTVDTDAVAAGLDRGVGESELYGQLTAQWKTKLTALRTEVA